MDPERFDSLIRKFGARADRRTVVRGLLGSALAALGAVELGHEVSAKAEKVLICHYTGSSSNPYNIMEVSGNALRAHQAHGDHLAFNCGNGPQCTACLPDVCTAGTVGVLDGDPWTVCRADGASAWLAATDSGIYDPVAACRSLGYSAVGRNGGHGGNVCGYCNDFDCERGTSCENLGAEIYDGHSNCEWDGSAGTLCFSVTWECLA